MQGVTNLSLAQVAFAYAFILVVLALIKWRRLDRGREVIIACLRMTLQLMLMGYVLVYLFANPSPWLTVLVLGVMELFAFFTIINRFKGKMRLSLKLVAGLSLGVGTLSCIVYFLLVVVQVAPWYDPQYVIPLAGMFIGNSMTGVALAVRSLLEGMATNKAVIEEALMLGAEPKMAVQNVINSTLEAAILPTINSMAGMGIVFLPGMMTGQILAGLSPTTAISYQIAIMLGILGSVAVAVIMTLLLGYRTFFNREKQLI
jgi:putative ABC transport system permease protein